MNERIRHFLSIENKSSAQLAEEIGVQPSGISHILSGRNNPSLDFVIKMLDRYKYISTDWLLFGTGEMYKEKKVQSLFDGEAEPGESKHTEAIEVDIGQKRVDLQDFDDILDKNEKEVSADYDKNKVVRIVYFYSNNRFEEFFPKKG